MTTVSSIHCLCEEGDKWEVRAHGQDHHLIVSLDRVTGQWRQVIATSTFSFSGNKDKAIQQMEDFVMALDQMAGEVLARLGELKETKHGDEWATRYYLDHAARKAEEYDAREAADLQAAKDRVAENRDYYQDVT